MEAEYDEFGNYIGPALEEEEEEEEEEARLWRCAALL